MGEYTKQALQKAGVTIYTKTRLDDISNNIALLNDGKKISTFTVIWAAGNIVEDVIQKIDTKHLGFGWFVDLFFPWDITRLSSVFDKKRTSITN